MEKKRLLKALRSSGECKKLWLTMKLSIVLIFSVVLSVSAKSYSQNQRVSLSLKDVSISELFEEIRLQSGCNFFFNEDKIAELEKVSLEKTDVTIKEILTEVLSGTNLTFTMVGDVIIIKTAEEVAQEQKQKSRNIKGKVFDHETGELLPGVNVTAKNSFLGTATNINGEFNILLPSNIETLEFSFIGYEKQEVKLDDRTDLVINLLPAALKLNDVVVTGYQTINKRELTSSISSISADELDVVASLSVDRMLEGKATGLMITNVSSTPGAAAKVQVRGGSTFTGNQSPLWVIDGIIYEDPVPLSADEINSFDNVNIIGNALAGLNPTDIAKIDVLKDASATAIYGTRAANGVIVITTKRGKKGSISLNYSGGLSFVQAPQYSDMNLMNSKERIEVSREIYERNLGYSTNYDNIDRIGYEGALMNLWDGTYNYQQFQDQVSYLETLNTDWFGELYRPSISQKHSISASGGSDNARYYFSLGYDDQQGAEKGVDLNRITARSNVDLDLRENVLLSFKMSGSVQKAKYNHSSVNAFNTAYYTSRTVPIYDEYGEYFYQSQQIYNHNGDIAYGRYNILNEMDNSERNVTNKELSISAHLRWDFLKNFRLTSLVSYVNTTNLNEEWITEDTYFIAKMRTYDAFEDMVQQHVDNNASVPFGGIYSGGMVSQDTYTVRNQLNYNKVFNDKHVLNVNIGHEARSSNYWGVTGFKSPGYNHTQGRGFIELPRLSYSTSTSNINFDAYDYDNMISWFVENSDNSIYPKVTDKVANSISMFGIFNYVYDNRYVANFNIRSDGSNAFGQYQRYKFKPTWSASARWNIHNESFFPEESSLEELAFRASYGVRGTMPNTSPYLIIKDYGRNDVQYYPENTTDLVEFPNANLRWEKTQTLNLGLNYSLMKGRISGAFDFAYSKSSDLIINRPVSLVNGASIQAYNAGSKDVSSYEFSINTINIKEGKFGWSTRFNFSYDKDRVLKGFEEGVNQNLTVNNFLAGSIHRSGFPTSGFFSYQFDKLNEQGLPTFKNLDMDEVSREKHLEAALVYEGTRSPKYYGGFGTELKYGNLRLSANFSYKVGYKTRLLSLYKGNQNLPLPYENMHSDFNNRWRKPGDEMNTNIPVISNSDLRFTYNKNADGIDNVYVSNYGWTVPQGKNGWWMYDNSDARVVKGDHIRLQTISLSYNVPDKFIERSGIKSLNLGLQASNVAVWAFDKKLKGQDPEQVTGLGLPNLSTYSFSLNMSF